MTEKPPQPRILVVEDEALTAMVLETCLRSMGCEVIGPAANVNGALKLADETALDGALLDVNLGGQPVYPVADRLAFRGVPFVFLTGYGAQAVPPAYGDRRVLQKPFSDRDLMRVVAEQFGLDPP